MNLGCDPERNGYLLYIPTLNRITTGYHVSFQERKFLTFTNKYIQVPPSPSPISSPPSDPHNEDSPVDIFNDETGVQQRGATPEDDGDDVPKQCGRTGCTLPDGHDGPHSYERVGTWKEGARRTRRQAQLMAEKVHDGNYFRVVLEDSSGQFFTVSSEIHLDNISIPDIGPGMVSKKMTTHTVLDY